MCYCLPQRCPSLLIFSVLILVHLKSVKKELEKLEKVR
jgi:hypothetical protein